MSDSKNIFILGDSYSTFKGYIPDGYLSWYTEGKSGATDVVSVTQTWWWQLINSTDSHLVRNDSWSGTTICNTCRPTLDVSTFFINRFEKLVKDDFFEQKEIDAVLIFGGTNDCWIDAPKWGLIICVNMWFILITAIVFSNLNYIFLHQFGNRDIKTTSDILLFNSMISLIWFVIIFVWGIMENGRFMMPSTGAIFFGVLYGLNLSVFLLFKMLSLTSGPVSITSLIASCSFIIATIFSVIYNNESVNVIEILGMIVMLLSLFLCMDRKNKSLFATKNWKYYIIIFFFAGGMIGYGNWIYINHYDRMFLEFNESCPEVALNTLKFVLGKMRLNNSMTNTIRKPRLSIPV